jgi:hypothetical protein
MIAFFWSDCSKYKRFLHIVRDVFYFELRTSSKSFLTKQEINRHTEWYCHKKFTFLHATFPLTFPYIEYEKNIQKKG